MDPLGAFFDFVADSVRLGYGVTRVWVLRAVHAALALGPPIALAAALLTRLPPEQAVPICAILAFPAVVWVQRVQQYFDAHYY